jgi:Tubulin-tyrosine ligase family
MFVHLTNYSLNKDNAQFRQATSVEDETSHKRTITNLYKRLEKDGHNVEEIQGEINDIIIKTLLAIQPELAHSYRSSQPSDIE